MFHLRKNKFIRYTLIAVIILLISCSSSKLSLDNANYLVMENTNQCTNKNNYAVCVNMSNNHILVTKPINELKQLLIFTPDKHKFLIYSDNELDLYLPKSRNGIEFKKDSFITCDINIDSASAVIIRDLNKYEKWPVLEPIFKKSGVYKFRFVDNYETELENQIYVDIDIIYNL